MDLSQEKCEPGMEEFLQEFLEDRKQELGELMGKEVKTVADDARQLGHKWIGFSRPYGFFTLESLGEKLKKSAKELNQTHFDTTLKEVAGYLSEKEKTLKD